MDKITNSVSHYIKEKKISVMHLAEKTGIAYSALYDSLLHKERDRELRAWEFMAICNARSIVLQWKCRSGRKQPDREAGEDKVFSSYLYRWEMVLLLLLIQRGKDV